MGFVFPVGFFGGIGGKLLSYAFAGDTNGVFYYIGTNYGTEPWVNPYDTGRITITASSLEGGSFSQLVDRYDNFVYTANVSNSYFIFDLGYFHSLVLKGYWLKAASFTGYEPRNFDVHGSNDLFNWNLLDRQINNYGIGGANQSLYISISSISAGYRYIKITQTAPGSGGADYFILGEVELYGEFS